MPIWDYLFLGTVLGFLAVLGDLCVSFLKRCANLKDCGTALGPHGGFLDRIDSFILIYPFLYWYALEHLNYTHSENYDFDNVHFMQFLKFK